MGQLTNTTSNSQKGCLYQITAGHNTNATIDGTLYPIRLTVRNASAGAVTFTIRNNENTLVEYARLRVGAASFVAHDMGAPTRVTGGVRIFRRGYGGNHGVNSTVTCQIYVR